MRNKDEFLRGTKIEVKNNDVSGALRKLKKIVATEGIIKEYRERQEYVSKSERRRKERIAARRRHLKELRKQDL